MNRRALSQHRQQIAQKSRGQQSPGLLKGLMILDGNRLYVKVTFWTLIGIVTAAGLSWLNQYYVHYHRTWGRMARFSYWPIIFFVQKVWYDGKGVFYCALKRDVEIPVLNFFLTLCTLYILKVRPDCKFICCHTKWLQRVLYTLSILIMD